LDGDELGDRWLHLIDSGAILDVPYFLGGRLMLEPTSDRPPTFVRKIVAQ
jgi:hypothetical protein